MEVINEIWVDVAEYEGIYKVSNLGKIKTLSRDKLTPTGFPCKTKERNLKQTICKNGYYLVALWKDGEHEYAYAHRLIAKAFLQNENNHREVNHKNGIKTDNRIENLEWVTTSQNKKHAFRTGLTKSTRGNKIWTNTLSEVHVKTIRDLHETEKYTNKYLGKIFSVSSSRISNIVNRKIWRYI